MQCAELRRRQRAGEGLPKLRGKDGLQGWITVARRDGILPKEAPTRLLRHAAAQALTAHENWEAGQAEHAQNVLDAEDIWHIPRRVQRARISEGPKYRCRKTEDELGHWSFGVNGDVRKTGKKKFTVPGGTTVEFTREVPDNIVSLQMVGTRRINGRIRWKGHVQVKEALESTNCLERIVSSEEGVQLVTSPEKVVEDVVAFDVGIVCLIASSSGATLTMEDVDPGGVRRKQVADAKAQRDQCRGPKRRRKPSRAWKARHAKFKKLRKQLREYTRHCMRVFVRQEMEGKTGYGLEALSYGPMGNSAQGTEEVPGRRVAQKRGLTREWREARPSENAGAVESYGEKNGMAGCRVNPYNSSITCHRCGHTHRDNRETQAKFRCKKCGHTENADVNAAKVLKQRTEKRLMAYFKAVARAQGKRSRHTASGRPPEGKGTRRKRPGLTVRSRRCPPAVHSGPTAVGKESSHKDVTTSV